MEWSVLLENILAFPAKGFLLNHSLVWNFSSLEIHYVSPELRYLLGNCDPSSSCDILTSLFLNKKELFLQCTEEHIHSDHSDFSFYFLKNNPSESEFFLKVNSRMYKEKDKVFVISQFLDLTAFHKELKIQERLFEDLHVLKIYLNSHFEFVRVNEVYAQACGHLPDYYQGKKFFSMYLETPEIRNVFEKVFISQKTEYLFGYPLNFLGHPDWGTTFWDLTVDVISEPLTGEPLLLVTFLDVTEKYSRERKHCAEERLFYSILESCAEGVVCIDNRGVIQFLNRSLAEIFQFEPVDLMYRNITILMPDTTADFHQSYINEFISGTSKRNIVGFTREVTAKRKNGELFPIELKVTEFKASESNHLFVGVIRDLSLEKEREALIREKEQEILKLQKLELLGKLSGNIIHDIGNFLQPVMLYSEMGEESCREESIDRDQLIEIFQKIREISKKIKNMSNEILGYTRSISSSLEDISFSEHITEVLKVMEIKYRECVFDIKIPPLSSTIRISSESIFQFISNLTVNAVHAMESKTQKKIRVELKILPIDPILFPSVSPKLKQMFYLEFEDSGEGMSEEVKDKIFQPFYTTKPKGKGSGLGLSIIHEIVKRHKGVVRIDSTIGVGTVFRFYFPAKESKIRKFIPSQEEHPIKFRIPKDTYSLAFFLLDKHFESRTTLQKALERKGNQVISNSNLELAYKNLMDLNENISVFLLEYFQESEELETLILLAKEKYPKAKILILTTREKKIEELLIRMVDGICYKPMMIKEIFQKIYSI
jgi:PAS domain S-box-containing protein